LGRGGKRGPKSGGKKKRGISIPKSAGFKEKKNLLGAKGNQKHKGPLKSKNPLRAGP